MLKSLGAKLLIVFGLTILLVIIIISLAANYATRTYFSDYLQHEPGIGMGMGRSMMFGQIENEFINKVNLAILFSALIALLIAGVFSYFFAQKITNRLNHLNVAANEMSRGNFKDRVPVEGQDELASLAISFNQMAASLEAAEQSQKNLITDVSHELKTPMSTIQGYIEALQDGVMTPSLENLESIHQEILLLSRLIDDLKDLSLAETGQLTLNLEPVNIKEMVQKIFEKASLVASEKNLNFKIDLAPDIPVLIADPARIQQVIWNLINNSFIYTSPGDEVSIKSIAKDGFIIISVCDSGQGIEKKDIKNIFDRFYRADKSRSRSSGGSGVGLTIAKSLVEAHNGRLQVESQRGAGTTFSIFLPVSGD